MMGDLFINVRLTYLLGLEVAEL